MQNPHLTWVAICDTQREKQLYNVESKRKLKSTIILDEKRMNYFNSSDKHRVIKIHTAYMCDSSLVEP